MSRADRFEFTLDEETEKRLYELLTDIDTRKTDRFCIQDKRGYHAEYVKVIRCRDCKHWNEYYRECQSPNWDTGTDDYFVTPAGFYCGYAEREEE